MVDKVQTWVNYDQGAMCEPVELLDLAHFTKEKNINYIIKYLCMSRFLSF